MKKILVLTVLLTMVFSIGVFAEEDSNLATKSANVSVTIEKHAEIDFGDASYSAKPKDYLNPMIPFTLETNTPVSLALTSTGFGNDQLNSWVSYWVYNARTFNGQKQNNSGFHAGDGTVYCKNTINNGKYEWGVRMTMKSQKDSVDSDWWKLESNTYTDQLTLTVVPTE